MDQANFNFKKQKNNFLFIFLQAVDGYENIDSTEYCG